MRWQDLSLAFVLACTASQSQAQPAWKPDRNVEIVVPSAPGGSNDKTARTVERIIQEKRLLAGTTLTVVNKPGGGNMMTMNYLIQHPGDAHYVMVGTPTILTNHIIGASTLNYTDFTPIASLFNDYVVFAVKADAPFKSGRDLAERLKKDPKSVSIGFATAVGSHNHIAAGLLAKAIGADVRSLKVIAFKGSAEAITALLGGHIELVTTAAGNVAEHVDGRQTARRRRRGKSASSRPVRSGADVERAGHQRRVRRLAQHHGPQRHDAGADRILGKNPVAGGRHSRNGKPISNAIIGRTILP